VGKKRKLVDDSTRKPFETAIREGKRVEAL
jgi:hypothetical protein